jgi:RNA polymerase sigma factor (TIGR02999 family)
MTEEPQTGALTHLLNQVGAGDEEAKSQFADMVYDELKEAAKRLLHRGGSGSLQPTALVNELFLRIFRKESFGKLRNRRYFFATAIDQMRKILVEHHRHRNRLKRGGQLTRVPMDEVLDQLLDDFEEQHRFDVEKLDVALKDLETHNDRQYKVICHRFYGGLTIAQTAELLDVSPGTVERDWRLARAKLFAQLRGSDK